MSSRRRAARVSVPGFAPFHLQLHDAGELVSDIIVRDGVWEPFESSLLSRLIDPGNWVVDVGANVGYYTRLAAQRVGPGGRVIALEPDADNFEVLRANTRDLPMVEARRVALGAERGSASVSRNVRNRGDLHLVEGSDVEVLRGDDLALPRLDLLKIDVQGAEVQVLRGFRETLARSRSIPSVLVEAWPYGLTRLGDSPGDLLDAILALERPVYLIDHVRGALEPLREAELRKLLLETLSVADQGFANLLLTRHSM